MFTAKAELVTLILTVLIPAATAAVTKANAPAQIKALVAFLLSGVVALVTESRIGDGSAVFDLDLVAEWMITMAMQLAAYLAVGKPLLSINSRLMPSFGIGAKIASGA